MNRFLDPCIGARGCRGSGSNFRMLDADRGSQAVGVTPSASACCVCMAVGCTIGVGV